MSGATAGQTFFTVGATAAGIGGKLVLQHGDQIVGVVDDLGRVLTPVSQTPDDAGRLLLTAPDGTVGYLDDADGFVITSSTLTQIDVYVDLVGFRRDHIMNRHGPGSGRSGKIEFPANWDEQRILHHISDVATDPASRRVTSTHGTQIYGVRDGIEIRVDLYSDNHPRYPGQISTGFPVAGPNVTVNP
ncbi:MAG: EndoU domain-containing protein [Paracoccaceae bacterium]